MHKSAFILLCCLFKIALLSAHPPTDTVGSIAEQIKVERANQLKELNEQLKRNEEEVKRLTDKLASLDHKKTTEKINALENLQIALDSRLKILEEAPKTRMGLNGQLAFTEMLSIQRDIQPAALFLSSRSFFQQLGSIGNIQQYKGFNDWKTEYDKWYAKKKNTDQMIDFVHKCLNLINDSTQKIPLYGAIAQAVSSGISNIVLLTGKKEKALADKTPAMLLLLNVIGQFEQQKSEIDHEWELINKELEQLEKENAQLLTEQLEYYGLDFSEYKTRYLEATLDNRRDAYKNDCRRKIAQKLVDLDANATTKGKWLGQVETYMYKVQSLRLRFGQLTLRMQANIARYDGLIKNYSDSGKFPAEFTAKAKGLENALQAVSSKFYNTFNPARYIEDSAIMYIERQP
jgi:hypothetical protein